MSFTTRRQEQKKERKALATLRKYKLGVRTWHQPNAFERGLCSVVQWAKRHHGT